MPRKMKPPAEHKEELIDTAERLFSKLANTLRVDAPKALLAYLAPLLQRNSTLEGTA